MGSPAHPTIEQAAQLLLEAVRPSVAALDEQQRELVLEAHITGFVRLALEFQTPARVAETLRGLAEALDPREG